MLNEFQRQLVQEQQQQRHEASDQVNFPRSFSKIYKKKIKMQPI